MIRLLSKETIDKIAAGEVVDRPENVVKELIDNAVDSGATAVSVEIRNGGTDLIRVTDNGCGISKADIPNAFVRHATSKLTAAEDLQKIMTMGFRGEALASIAGVSRVELITKRKEDITGHRYVIEGGREISLKEIGIPDGTTLIIRDLFFNVPVRKQFLKSARTEGSYVRDVVEKAALSFTGISFSFISDGRQLFHTSGNGKLKDVIYTVYGNEISQSLLSVDYQNGTVSVSGLISKPVLSRSKRDFEICFVNGRHVRSNIIERAVETAYEGYLMQHRFPFTVLKIDISPEKIDVNIHPKKTEIRFSDDEAVFNAVYDAVKNTISHRELIPEAFSPEKKQETKNTPHFEPFEEKLRGLKEAAPEIDAVKKELEKVTDGFSNGIDRDTEENAQLPIGGNTRLSISESTGEDDETVSGMLCDSGSYVSPYEVVCEDHTDSPEEIYEQQKFISEEAKPYYRFIGQLFETYWMIEYENSLYIIDQHAAHEKVNYEKMLAAIQSNEAAGQMIIPMMLSLNASEAALLTENMEAFNAVGFEIEPAGDKDFVVRAVPAQLPELSSSELLMDMIDSLSELKTGVEMKVLKEKVASMACKASVKGNMRLSEREMRALTDELLTLKDPYNCPHGRPVIVKLSHYDLDKMFKRIV